LASIWLSGCFNPPILRELNSGQWWLFARVQPGNGIKFAMFRKPPFEFRARAVGNSAEHAA
jgi:hypothetical protein